MIIPTHLSDSQLVQALKRCTSDERRSTAELVAHLAEMDARQIHLRAGFGSLFSYCCELLRLSESATYKRIEVARAVRRHPVILERLCDGALNLTTARLLAPHLTVENVEPLIAAAVGRGKRAVEELLARQFPRPDVPALVRKLPARQAPSTPYLSTPPRSQVAAAKPLVVPLSADRYQIRFTASASTRRKLTVARDLLRQAVPSGDPGEIFDRALTALIAELEKKKCAAVTAPAPHARPIGTGSRHIPAKVRRAVWTRDQGRCAFVGGARRRCDGRASLEFHHVHPYAVGGPPTVANIQLRCRAHNAYESEVFYGADRWHTDRSRSSGEVARGSNRFSSTGPGAS